MLNGADLCSDTDRENSYKEAENIVEKRDLKRGSRG